MNEYALLAMSAVGCLAMLAATVWVLAQCDEMTRAASEAKRRQSD